MEEETPTLFLNAFLLSPHTPHVLKSGRLLPALEDGEVAAVLSRGVGGGSSSG